MRIVAARRLTGITAVLDGVHDPHNISAVLRSCEGFGVQNVHMIGSPENLVPNRIITRGCQKWLTLHYHVNADACARVLKEEGYKLLAAMLDREAKPLDEVDFTEKTALLFGNERDGVSDRLMELADGKFFIPMSGFSQSLNISVAAAISMHVATTARRKHIGESSDLPEAGIDKLATSWIDADTAKKMRQPPPQA